MSEEATLEECSDDAALVAGRLVALGRRNLLMGLTADAVENLQRACELLAERYGETAAECAEVYYLYGNALLETARQHSGVLGSNIPATSTESAQRHGDAEGDTGRRGDTEGDTERRGDTEGDTGRGGDTEGDTERRGDTEGERAKEDRAKGKLREDDAETRDTPEPGDKGKTKAPAASSQPQGNGCGDDDGDGDDDEDGEDGEDGEDEGEEEGEEEDDMKLAWEMLELSKVIYGRQSGREAQLNRAQVHLKLGELGMEREDYAQATEDLSICLSLQSSLLAPDDRLLAETQYQLGVSALLAQRHGEAVNHFCLARDIIQSRLDSLGAGGDERVERECRDLRLLLPELAERIQDARDSATHQLLTATTTTDSGSAFSKTADDASSSSSTAPTSSSAAPTSSSAAAASSTSEAFGTRQPSSAASSSAASSSAASSSAASSSAASASAAAASSSSAVGAALSASAPVGVSNINHLVRRKNKLEESETRDEDSDKKRIRLQNGDSEVTSSAKQEVTATSEESK